MFDDATTLVKCSADLIAQAEEEAEAAEEIACSSTVNAIPDARRYSENRLCRKPSVSTPLKPSKDKKRIREELEDSDARLSPPPADGKKKKWLGPVAHLSHVPN
nr:hypothetical protein [Tanacetum cinerariifolium]